MSGVFLGTDADGFPIVGPEPIATDDGISFLPIPFRPKADPMPDRWRLDPLPDDGIVHIQDVGGAVDNDWIGNLDHLVMTGVDALAVAGVFGDDVQTSVLPRRPTIGDSVAAHPLVWLGGAALIVWALKS